jgi:hypothetical protein
LPADTGNCTELFAPVLLATDPDDFLTGEVRVTVETELVDSVVVASVSTGAAAPSVPVEEDAVAVSAPDRSERAQAAANATAARAPASDSLVIDRFP